MTANLNIYKDFLRYKKYQVYYPEWSFVWNNHINNKQKFGKKSNIPLIKKVWQSGKI